MRECLAILPDASIINMYVEVVARGKGRPAMVVVADSVCSQCRNSIPGSIGRCVAGSSAAYQNQAFHFLPGPVLNTLFILY